MLLAFIRLSRLHFLLGGFLMFALGAASENNIDWSHYWVAQVAVTASQLTAHYLNEYADFEVDMSIVNRTAFSGGSGVLVSGQLTRNVALRAGQVTTGASIAAALVVFSFSIETGLLILITLASSWAYSMPPIRLLNTGWGETTTAVTVAGLVPLVGALTQSAYVSMELWCFIGVLVCLQVAMLLSFELPDLESDKRAGKSVLGVRLGAQRTSRLIILLIGAATLVTLMAALCRWVGALAGLLSLANVPFVGLLLGSVKRTHHVLITFAGVATFFVCGAAFTLSEVLG